MKFSLLIQEAEEELKKDRSPDPEPWSLEIRKDPSKSKQYNEMGDLIIKLFALRSKMG
jgi:hypothetical protein